MLQALAQHLIVWHLRGLVFALRALVDGYMLTCPPPQDSYLLRTSQPADIIEPLSSLQGRLVLSWHQRAPNPVLALAELTSTLAHKLASSTQAESDHASADPVHVAPRPTPPLTMHYSPLSLLLVQIWTWRTMFARSHPRALEFSTEYLGFVNYTCFRLALLLGRYSRSGTKVDGADSWHQDIACNIEQVRFRSFVWHRSCRHSSLVPPFLIPLGVTCRSLNIALTLSRS